MAEIICVIGNKGGTGKTTLSHMLCQGLGLLGQRSVCVLTDTHREPLDPDGRPEHTILCQKGEWGRNGARTLTRFVTCAGYNR